MTRNSTEHSSSSYANIRSVSKEILGLLWNPNIHHCVHKGTLLNSVPTHEYNMHPTWLNEPPMKYRVSLKNDYMLHLLIYLILKRKDVGPFRLQMFKMPTSSVNALLTKTDMPVGMLLPKKPNRQLMSHAWCLSLSWHKYIQHTLPLALTYCLGYPNIMKISLLQYTGSTSPWQK
jgi:hypothetical protein